MFSAIQKHCFRGEKEGDSSSVSSESTCQHCASRRDGWKREVTATAQAHSLQVENKPLNGAHREEVLSFPKSANAPKGRPNCLREPKD